MFGGNQTLITGGSFTQINGAPRDGFHILQGSVADGAFHNSKERFDPPKCHEKTRVAVLQRILDWVFRQDPDTHDAFVMWLYGPAGAGKSAIAQTIAERLDASHHLVASFFFSRNHPTRGNADRLVATIAYQLALILPPTFRQNLVHAVEYDPLIFSKTLEVQFAELITKPMERLFMSGFSTPHLYLVIIDGLDECDNRQVQSKIVDLAFQVHQTAQHLPILCLISSRPELEISASFECRNSDPMLLRLALDDTYHPDDDIRQFLTAKFEEIKNTHRFRSTVPESWPTEEAVETLVSKSSGQFIYVATVVKYVASIRNKPTELLDKILGLRPLGKDTPFAELDSLYTHILSGVDDVKTVLMAIAVAALKPTRVNRPGWRSFVYTRHIECLLSLDPDRLHILFQDLNSLIALNHPFGEGGGEVHIQHASLSDFLFDKSRSQDLWVSSRSVHNLCANRSLSTVVKDITKIHFTVVEEMLHRLWHHFPFADTDSMIVQNVLDFTFPYFMSIIRELYGDSTYSVDDSNGRAKCTIMIGNYIDWVGSIAWDDRDVSQFKTDQLSAFDAYLITHMEAYFANQELLLTLLVNIGTRRIVALMNLSQLSRRIDNERLMVNSMTVLYLPHTYRHAISAFLHDPSRSGRYFLHGAKYANVAYYALTRLCNKWSHVPPKSLSLHYSNTRRNYPARWHRRKARGDNNWSAYSRRDIRGDNGKLFDNMQFMDIVDRKQWMAEMDRSIRASFTFSNILLTLPDLLKNSGRSEELIGLARTAKFGVPAKRLCFVDKVWMRTAKKAIKEYLARMER